jgi:hypothetical protein
MQYIMSNDRSISTTGYTVYLCQAPEPKMHSIPPMHTNILSLPNISIPKFSSTNHSQVGVMCFVSCQASGRIRSDFDHVRQKRL